MDLPRGWTPRAVRRLDATIDFGELYTDPIRQEVVQTLPTAPNPTLAGGGFEPPPRIEGVGAWDMAQPCGRATPWGIEVLHETLGDVDMRQLARSLLGSGGYGAVFSGTFRDRDVATKLFLCGEGDDDDEEDEDEGEDDSGGEEDAPDALGGGGGGGGGEVKSASESEGEGESEEEGEEEGGYTSYKVGDWRGEASRWSTETACARGMVREMAANAWLRHMPGHPSLVVGGEAVMDRWGRAHLVMPRPEGVKSLYDLELEGMGAGERESFAAQLLHALCHMHLVAGVVHGDLSPQNVMWDGERAWVIDWGTAAPVRLVDHIHAARATAKGPSPRLPALSPDIGAAYAQAPELLLGMQGHSSRIDVWGIGLCILYLLTGDAGLVQDGAHVDDDVSFRHLCRTIGGVSDDSCLARSAKFKEFTSGRAFASESRDSPRRPRRGAKKGKRYRKKAEEVGFALARSRGMPREGLVWRRARTVAALEAHPTLMRLVRSMLIPDPESRIGTDAIAADPELVEMWRRIPACADLPLTFPPRATPPAAAPGPDPAPTDAPDGVDAAQWREVTAWVRLATKVIDKGVTAMLVPTALRIAKAALGAWAVPESLIPMLGVGCFYLASTVVAPYTVGIEYVVDLLHHGPGVVYAPTACPFVLNHVMRRVLYLLGFDLFRYIVLA